MTKARKHYKWEPNKLAEHYSVQELETWGRELRQKEGLYYLTNGRYTPETLKKIGALHAAKLFVEAHNTRRRGEYKNEND
ncbi:MAG: hypothetical protein HKM07_05325 [Chlamydiae bacterium]|nr:hypothetical protein [Chlamydiota bacterium]